MLLEEKYKHYENCIENNTEDLVLQTKKYRIKDWQRDMKEDVFLNVLEEGNNFKVILFCGNNKKKVRKVYHVNSSFEIYASETQKWQWED